MEEILYKAADDSVSLCATEAPTPSDSALLLLPSPLSAGFPRLYKIPEMSFSQGEILQLQMQKEPLHQLQSHRAREMSSNWDDIRNKPSALHKVCWCKWFSLFVVKIIDELQQFLNNIIAHCRKEKADNNNTVCVCECTKIIITCFFNWWAFRTNVIQDGCHNQPNKKKWLQLNHF